MGLVCVHNPEWLVLREVQTKMRSKNTIRKCDSNWHNSQVQSTGVTHKCDQQVRLTSAINRCDSQVRSIESRVQSLQVCKLAKLESSGVQKFALKTHKKSKKLF